MAQVISLQTSIESKSKACVGCCPEPIKGFPFFIPPNATVLEAALVYARFGWPVFPVVPKYKVPYAGSHGHLDADTDPVRIRRWWVMHPESMIGVPMGSRSGVFCVDLDRKPGEADGVATWAKITAEKGAALTMSNISPSTGEHHLFQLQHVEGVRSISLDKFKEFAPGVEIKGEGGFVVMPPSRGYVWNTPLLAPAPAPDWLVNEILAICAPPKFAPPPSDREPVSDEKIRAALAAIGHNVDRKTWIAIGGALCKELGDAAGFALWNEWSSKSKEEYNPKNIAKQWKPIAENNGYAYNIATLFWHANQAQPGWWVEAEARIEAAWAAELAEATAKAAAEMLAEAAEPAESTIAAAESTITTDTAPNETNTAQPAEPKREPAGGTNGGQEPNRPGTPDDGGHHEGDTEWPEMDEAAYYGFAGEVVGTIAPHTEADPVALLLQLLTCFGNIIGRTRHIWLDGSDHYANLYTAMVGASAKARKGTALERVRVVVQHADSMWEIEHIQGGLSSGEGLIHAVRDPIIKPNKEGQLVTVDQGVTDKRLLIVEPEFASVLAVMARGNNTVSMLLRKAWDGQRLQTMTRKEPLTATGAHISVIGHITEDELRACLTRTDMANGFANRFLFACARRTNLLPSGGNPLTAEIARLGERLKEIVEAVTGDPLYGIVPPPLLTKTEAAQEMWDPIYRGWAVERPGLLGAVTARAEPQTLRLAMIYALLDKAKQIDVAHLRAAVAVWNYCEASAVRIFGESLGDEVADAILRALKNAGRGGLSRWMINDLFSGHQPSARISGALALLTEKGRARGESQAGTRGRPIEMWFAI